MTPERAREILRQSGGFAPLIFLTPAELDWVHAQIPAETETTLADLIRRVATPASEA